MSIIIGTMWLHCSYWESISISFIWFENIVCFVLKTLLPFVILFDFFVFFSYFRLYWSLVVTSQRHYFIWTVWLAYVMYHKLVSIYVKRNLELQQGLASNANETVDSHLLVDFCDRRPLSFWLFSETADLRVFAYFL